MAYGQGGGCAWAQGRPSAGTGENTALLGFTAIAPMMCKPAGRHQITAVFTVPRGVKPPPGAYCLDEDDFGEERLAWDDEDDIYDE